MIRRKKFQSTLEYATLIVIVVGALLWMKSWMQKGLQGKYQVVGKQLGSQWSKDSNQSSSMKVSTHTSETNDRVVSTSSRAQSEETRTPGEQYDETIQ